MKIAVRTMPGTGLVARCGEGVMVLGTQDPSLDETRQALLSAFNGVCEADQPAAGVLARRLIARIIDLAVDRVPAFAAAARSPRGIEVLVVGGASAAWPEGDEVRTASGRDATNWVDRSVGHDIEWLTLTLEGADGSPSPLTDLGQGVVSGDGARLEIEDFAPSAGPAEPAEPVVAEPAPPPPTVAADTPEPPTADVDSDPEPAPYDTAERVLSPDLIPPEQPAVPKEVVFDSISLLEPPEESEPAEPLPVATPEEPPADHVPEIAEAARAAEGAQVMGVRCRKGHFNHPQARYCYKDGTGFDSGESRVVTLGTRPPLGVLVIDDGSAFVLDTDYVVGRDPQLAPEMASGTVRPLILVDEQRSVSRVHADIKLDGWDALVTDRSSANGTFLLSPGNQQWTRLTAGQPAPLLPGARVAVGRRSFLFESHHVQSN